MSATLSVVRDVPSHRHPLRGDTSMTKKQVTQNEEYAATYKFGNTVVHVVAPPPMTDEEISQVLSEHHAVGWSIIEELENKAVN